MGKLLTLIEKSKAEIPCQSIGDRRKQVSVISNKEETQVQFPIILLNRKVWTVIML